MIFGDWPWRHWRSLRPDARALRLGDECLTRRQLCRRIDALAAGFIARGVRPEQGVMLRAYNHPQTLLAWLALLQCGARILPVNPQIPRALLAALLPHFSVSHALLLADDAPFDALAALSLREAQGACDAGWQPERLATLT